MPVADRTEVWTFGLSKSPPLPTLVSIGISVSIVLTDISTGTFYSIYVVAGELIINTTNDGSTAVGEVTLQDTATQELYTITVDDGTFLYTVTSNPVTPITLIDLVTSAFFNLVSTNKVLLLVAR